MEEAVPAQQAPTKQTPTGQASTGQASTGEASTKQAPTEQDPATHASTEEASTRQAPTEQDPATPASTQQAPAEPHFPNPLRLAAAVVMTADGRRAGRVRDVYVDDDTGLLAGVTVVMGRVRQHHVLLPVIALAADEPNDDGILTLVVDKDTLRSGVQPPHTGHITTAGLRDAAEALGLDPEAVTLPDGPSGKRTVSGEELQQQRERAAAAEQPEGSPRA